MIHHIIDGQARHQTIVGVAQMSVVIDPTRLDRGPIEWQFGQRPHSTQLQFLARLRGGQHSCSHGLDDGACLFHQLRIARVHPLLK